MRFKPLKSLHLILSLSKDENKTPLTIKALGASEIQYAHATRLWKELAELMSCSYVYIIN